MSTESTDQFAVHYPWISTEFFERILRREHQDNSIVVKGYTLKAALGKGENYISQMLRAHVNFSSTTDPSVDHISLILKAAIINNDEWAALATELKVFRKEIITYQQIIPEVEKLLRSIDDYSRVSAKCYDASEELSYLVFEDLSASGYTNVDKKIGLDMEHFKHLMTKAAKWHATTAVLVNKNPSLANDFQSCLLLTERFKPMMINSINALVEVVKQIPGFQHLLPKLQRLSTCIIQKLTMAAQSDPNAFNVINHGDMWSNNAMFRYDSVSLLDAILVDFQCGYFASPALDILNIIFTSSSKALRAHDWDEIVIHYHTELVSLLNKFAYSKPVPTLSEFQAERRNRIHYSAPMGIFALGIRNIENMQDTDVAKFFGQSEEDHNYRVQALLTPKYRKDLEFLLQFCDDNGLLDV